MLPLSWFSRMQILPQITVPPPALPRDTFIHKVL